jgi:hypothetical protein
MHSSFLSGLASNTTYLDGVESAFPILPNLCLILLERRFLCIQGLRAAVGLTERERGGCRNENKRREIRNRQ